VDSDADNEERKMTTKTYLVMICVYLCRQLQHANAPFGNGAKEIKEMYLRIYDFDYQKAYCNKNDFEVGKLD
jgi:hypothetical protein